jgi:hypothetical protein
MVQQETPALRAAILVDLATVLSHANRTEEARQALADAIAVYEAKGATALIAGAQKVLARLR